MPVHLTGEVARLPDTAALLADGFPASHSAAIRRHRSDHPSPGIARASTAAMVPAGRRNCTTSGNLTGRPFAMTEFCIRELVGQASRPSDFWVETVFTLDARTRSMPTPRNAIRIASRAAPS